MMNNNPKPDTEHKSKRRQFVASALLSLTAVVTGCSQTETAPNAADEADLNSLKRVDPKRITFRNTRKLDTGFDAPTGIALSTEGDLIVVGDAGLIRFDETGKQVSKISLSARPTCVSMGKGGDIYVGLLDHVQVFHSNGRNAVIRPAVSARAHIKDLLIVDHSIWVADAGGRQVMRCTPDGDVAVRFGDKDEASHYPGLVVPSPHLSLAPAQNGQIFVTNPGQHRVETHASTSGECISFWGTAANTLDSFCGCCNPTDIAVLPDGRFVTSEKGIPRVKIYTHDGKFDEVVAASDQFTSSAMGLDLAVTATGQIYVLDPPSRSVLVFERT